MFAAAILIDTGDCWFLSSVGSLCVDEEDRHLIERLCPPKARNEKVGVYGFVFYRDGEWISEIIDDKLYLSCPDYDNCNDSRRYVWDRSHSKIDPTEKRKGFRKAFQTGSDALFYGSCADENETWVPLLEKAFAKAHGDYNAINGGWPGEGLEDLTGGITTMIMSDDILDLDELWTEGLMHVNKTFLFGVGTRNYQAGDINRQGIEDGHAYSVLKAVEYKEERLLLIKNPWGSSEVCIIVISQSHTLTDSSGTDLGVMALKSGPLMQCEISITTLAMMVSFGCHMKISSLGLSRYGEHVCLQQTGK